MARKQGAKNIQDTVNVALSRCLVCGSTDREEYRGVITIEHGGITGEGHPYTHIVIRSTRCKGCGQARRDRSLENRTADIRNPNIS